MKYSGPHEGKNLMNISILPPPLLSQRRYPGGMSESDILRRVNNPVTNQRPTTYDPTPHSYIGNNKRKLQPTEIDLLEVINKKIELLDR